MSTSADFQHRPVWGLVAFIVGAVALVVVTLQISGAFVEKDRSTAMVIGEIAAEIRTSAQRALAGEPSPAPAPSAAGWDADRLLLIAGPGLAGIAAVLGAIGLFRREAPKLPGIAIAMGASAFVMQYVFWLAILIGGVCVLIAVLNNIEEILGG